MADVNIGDIVARLRIDSSGLQQGMQQAQAAFAQLQRTVQGQASATQQFTPIIRQAMQEAAIAARQSAQESSQAFRREAQERTVAAQQAAQAARQQYQQIAIDARKAAQESSQAFAREMAELRRGQATTASIVQGALSVAGGLGIATSIAGIVSGLKNLVTESVQAAASMEQLRAQFTALQGPAQGAVTLQGLFQTAQRLGIEFTSLATAFRSFDAATRGTALEGEKARRVFEQITTGARAMGSTSEQTARALLALQQMVSKGLVSQEELRQQLGEALPGAMNIAARAFGVTTQEMNKMVEKGMDAIAFVQAFGTQVEREFTGKAALATNTLTSAWQRFQNELQQFQGALAGGDLMNTLRDLVGWSTRLLENLRGAAELRRERTGGDLPVIPREMAGFPVLEARQKAMQDLQEFLRAAERGFTIFDRNKFGVLPTEDEIAKRRAQLAELTKEQIANIQRIQDQWTAEGALPTTVPGARALQAVQKILEDGRKELQRLDLTAAFVTPLELAEEKAKVWEQAMKRAREEAQRLGEGLRSTLTPSGRATPFDAMIEEAAGRYGQDPAVIRALIEQESGFNPQARSRAGALGLMQIMPGTAAQYGAAGADLLNARTNIELGVKIFADLMQRFNGNLERALTAYNAGPGRGGIPLPAGENATFAQDVLRRMQGGGIGDLLQQGAQLGRALGLGVDALKPDTERLKQTLQTGREDLQRFEANEAEKLADARKARQERLKDLDIFGLLLSPEQEEELKHQATEQRNRVRTFAENLDIFGLNLSPEVEARRRATEAFGQRVQQQIDQELATRATRPEARLRAEAMRGGVAITPDLDAQLKRLTALREEQERLNHVIDIWSDLASGVGSAWSSAMEGIASHTKTVAEAFREMGRSILQTMGQIASQEAFKALFRLGASVITGALTGGGQVGFGAGSGFDVGLRNAQPLPAVALQAGGVVTRPTLALLGEGRETEYVLNQRQMQAMQGAMRSGEQAGGTGNISIHNHPTREAAERAAAQDRAAGHTAIINAVLSDMQQGEGSQINRLARRMQR